MPSSRPLRGRLRQSRPTSSQTTGNEDQTANRLEVIRARLDVLFWAWRWFLVLAVGTALAIDTIVGVISGRPPDSAILDWLRRAM